MINIIARSNKTDKNDKKYIIDTLIDLTELNLKTRRKKYNYMVKIQEELALNDKTPKNDDELLNKIDSNNKNLEFDDFISGNDLIKDEVENEVIIPDKNSYYSNYKNIDNSINQNFFDNNNSLLLSDNSMSFKIDSVSVEPVDCVLKKNIESTFFKFIN